MQSRSHFAVKTDDVSSAGTHVSTLLASILPGDQRASNRDEQEYLVCCGPEALSVLGTISSWRCPTVSTAIRSPAKHQHDIRMKQLPNRSHAVSQDVHNSLICKTLIDALRRIHARTFSVLAAVTTDCKPQECLVTRRLVHWELWECCVQQSKAESWGLKVLNLRCRAGLSHDVS